jgi:predicted TIM-barrel fold metal-dependent hydrolase
VQLEDLVLVSIDDHVVEPADMFEGHVPEKWRDQAPRVELVDGVEVWQFQEAKNGSSGLNAVVTWPKEEWGLNPTAFSEMRPGAYDIHERVRDMSRNGVLASMCFPGFAGFAGSFFNGVSDKDLSTIMVSAYNDWHVDEFCATYPERFIPMGLLPVWDPQAAAAEVERLVAKGCRSVSLPELPHVMDLPSYHALDYWAPLFDTVSDLGVVTNMHIGQGFFAIKGPPEAGIDNLMILATQVSAFSAQDLLWGGAFQRWPDLKVAFSEGGIGWISFFLDRCDRHYQNQIWIGHDFGGKLPSEVFREHCLACFVTDPTALKVRHDIGMDIIAWENDYPHSDSIWPDAPESIYAEMTAAGCTDAEMEQITWGNMARFYDYDPFAIVPREQANVGALRAQALDVDTSIRPKAEWRARAEAKAAAGAE